MILSIISFIYFEFGRNKKACFLSTRYVPVDFDSLCLIFENDTLDLLSIDSKMILSICIIVILCVDDTVDGFS